MGLAQNMQYVQELPHWYFPRSCPRSCPTNISIVQLYTLIVLFEPLHAKVNKMTCVPSEDRSAWAYAQSDQSSLSAWRSLLGLWLSLECTATAKTLIRLGGCLGWSSSLGAQVILLVLSCCSSFFGSWNDIKAHCRTLVYKHVIKNYFLRFCVIYTNMLKNKHVVFDYNANTCLVQVSHFASRSKISPFNHSCCILASERDCVSFKLYLIFWRKYNQFNNLLLESPLPSSCRNRPLLVWERLELKNCKSERTSYEISVCLCGKRGVNSI